MLGSTSVIGVSARCWVIELGDVGGIEEPVEIVVAVCGGINSFCCGFEGGESAEVCEEVSKGTEVCEVSASSSGSEGLSTSMVSSGPTLVLFDGCWDVLATGF